MHSVEPELAAPEHGQQCGKHRSGSRLIGLEALKKVPKAADDGHIIPQPSRVATRA